MSKYRPVSASLSPNFESDDILLAKKLLLNPRHLVAGSGPEKLEEKFKEYLKIKYAYSFRSGRSALYAALRALNLRPGDEVILQAYTCAVVPNAVIWTGATPVYADIDEETFNMSLEDMESKITSRTRAIIVQHTFGLPANMRRIMLIAKRKNIAVIEDCAHSLGSTYEGVKTGVMGDMAIFSFGRDKVISSVSGGMLVTNNFFISKKIESIRSKYRKPTFLWTIRNLLYPILMEKLILPTYNFKNLGKFLLELIKRTHISPKVVYKIEKEGGKEISMIGLMPNALAILALRQLRKLDKFNDHRMKLANFYMEEIKKDRNLLRNIKLPRLSKIDERDKKHIFLRFTIKTLKAKQLIRFARAHNVILGDWYNRAVAPVGVDYEKIKYHPEDCPSAEDAALQSVNLPTNINTSETDARKVITILKKFFFAEHD